MNPSKECYGADGVLLECPARVKGNTVISRSTLIPIGVVALVLVFLLGASWSLADILHNIDQRLMAIEFKVEDRWTAAQMSLWAQRLQKQNATLNIPDVYAVKQDMQRSGPKE